MRIGIDARFYGSLGKGLGRYTAKLIEGLEQVAGTDEFIVFLRRENFDEYQPRQPRFTKVLADFPWYGWREQLLLPRLLRQYRLDLMHFPHFNVPLLYRRPLVVTIHDLILFHYPTVKASELPPVFYWLKYAVYRYVIRSAVKRALTVFTVSRFTQADLVAAYPSIAPKIRMIYEAADAECAWTEPTTRGEFLRAWGLSPRGEGTPYVLSVGNAYPHKNLSLLLQVAKSLPEKLFVCVGREDYFYTLLKAEAEALGITNVRFVGFVPDGALGILYREAESYFFPSLYEGFGLPALEALLVGTPVVAARAGALPEILGAAGRLFDPTSVTEARETLIQVGADSALRQCLITRGYARVALFSWQRMACLTLEEYHRSIAYARHSSNPAH